MTVVAGFLSPKGIVMTSDSLESTATGYGKGMVKKVFIHPVPGGMFYFAGAGLPGPCEFVRQEILERLTAESAWNIKKYVAEIRKSVRYYYAESVWPSGRETSQFAAMMALWGSGNEHILLKTDQDVSVTTCEAYGCVGIGAKAAERVAELLLPTKPTGCVVATFDQLVAIAAYVIWVAKETIDGCGGTTQFAVFEKDKSAGPTHHTAAMLDVLERAFGDIERAEGRLIARLLNQAVDINVILKDFEFAISHAPRLKFWRDLQAEYVAQIEAADKPSPKKADDV